MASHEAKIEHYRKNAEIYNGNQGQCKKKSQEILEELSLPKGLLPLEEQDLTEVGYNRAAGFVWLKQKKKKEYYFSSIGTTVSYAPEVTAFVENRRIKNLTGVTGIKKFLFCSSISEIYMKNPFTEITFKIPTGFSLSFPVAAFHQ